MYFEEIYIKGRETKRTDTTAINNQFGCMIEISIYTGVAVQFLLLMTERAQIISK